MSLDNEGTTDDSHSESTEHKNYEIMVQEFYINRTELVMKM